ncbi:MAG: rhodanese-like domain-containing protein [Lachnospiraceae bacterium]|nr:rhodanese-like domain-containing protein [Lachnospiraceae bacterium]
MKKNKTLLFALAALLISLISGCALPANENKQALYTKISAAAAYKIMKSGDDFILLDVRTIEEYVEKHIAGAILIPDYEIASRAEIELTDKDTIILVYCRSGRRSENAAKELVEMGYTNVYDFGGIIDWPYGTVSE